MGGPQKKMMFHIAIAEEAKICERCGEIIIGEYDFVRTRRGTEIYFHKSMKCAGGKRNG